jgi:hypothetical protein
MKEHTHTHSENQIWILNKFVNRLLNDAVRTATDYELFCVRTVLGLSLFFFVVFNIENLLLKE